MQQTPTNTISRDSSSDPHLQHVNERQTLENHSLESHIVVENVKGQRELVPLPEYVRDDILEISENSRKVLERRYRRKDLDGNFLESAAGMFYRVARHVAQVENEHDGDMDSIAQTFYELLTQRRFFPNSPTFTGAGTPLGQLAACFVLPIADDMGQEGDGIFSTLRVAALIQQTGGGNGFAFSRLRPRGDVVHTSSGQATGPVGFLHVYDQAFGEIAQGGCLVPDTLIFTEDGMLRLDELVNSDIRGWQEHNLSVQTDEGARNSGYGYNHGVAPVLTVETQQGIIISGTPNHKVKIMTDDGPAWCRLDELEAGNSILMMLGEHQGKLRSLHQPQKFHGNQTEIALPPILDEPLAFLLGYMAGDGFVASGEKDNRIGFSVAHDSHLMEELPNLLTIIFPGCNIHTQQKPNDASVNYVIDSAIVKHFMITNGFAKGKSHEVSIPKLVRQSPANIVGAYLRGLFEADGSVSHGYPMLNTTSEQLARESATLLIGLGCPVSIRMNEYEGRWGDKPQWVLGISSHVGLEAWRENISCDLRSRFVACQTFSPDRTRESSYNLSAPQWWLQPVLDEITLPQIDRQGRGQNINLRSTEPQLRKKLLRYVRSERNFTASGHEELSSNYPVFAEHARPIGNQWFVNVTNVYPSGESLTLDLEVDENHTYLANGMVTHNSRRGANMGVLRVDHPDIEDFIKCKAEEGTVANFNISVAITDEFMHAVKDDTDFELRNPRDNEVWKTVRARELFDQIVTYAHRNGEPGLLFIDAANRSNPVPHLYDLEATNPCGEQWLGPYENCCLGSINLGEHVTTDEHNAPVVDWSLLERTIRESTHFLDNVVTTNKYVPVVPEVAAAAFRARRIGLGIMGLGDMMYKLGIRYGSEEGQEFAAQIMEFTRFHCMKKSIELSSQRGPFLAYEGSIYDSNQPDGMKWQIPQSVFPYNRDWQRPSVDWRQIQEGIVMHGIRNAAQTTVAPTGTIATVCGCEGYGCEPVFALGYTRHFKDGDNDVELLYTSPLFEEALSQSDLTPEAQEEIKQQVALYGSCQDVPSLPEHLRHTYVVSSDITAEQHVRMQAAIQAFVDNSISKCVVGDTLLLTAAGLAPLQTLSEMRLPDQFEPLGIDIVSPMGIERSDQFFYGGYRETRKVAFDYGFEVEGTPNHRIHVLEADGSVQFRRLDQLMPGDTAVLYGNQRQFGPMGQRLPAYSGALRTNSKTPTFPERMSEQLAFYLGCITSEGAITRNGLNISNNDRGLLEELNTISTELLGLPGRISQDKRNNVHYLQVNSRPLRNWLLVDLDLEAGAENKIIPSCILEANEQEIAAFLRGLFLDGYMTADGKLFGINVASQRMISQLQTLMLNIGVLATTRQSTDRAWCLTVQGGELEVLAQQISFVEVWKNERIEQRNKGRNERYRNYSRLLPNTVTEDLRQMQELSSLSLRQLYHNETDNDQSAYQRSRVNLLQGHRLERNDAQRIYQHLSQDSASPYGNTFSSTFFGHDSDNKIYVTVQSVAAGYAEVFDISVPGSHSFIANGLGNHNTCNFPEGATEADVAQAYQLAWELGCKGLTVYVTGSRQQVVLETKATQQKKDEGVAEAVEEPKITISAPESVPISTNGYHPNVSTNGANINSASMNGATMNGHSKPDVLPLVKRPRPSTLEGRTYRKETPLGQAYVTINKDDQGEPFEVFLNVGKAGSDVTAVSEAIGRLISLVLRVPSALQPNQRLRWVKDELTNIGSGSPRGFGSNRVRSLPDGIAQVLAEYLSELEPNETPITAEQLVLPMAQRPIGDLCPECGEASFLNIEGCRKCHICGYSEC